MIRKILGLPGTGKTTKLLHYVRTLVKFGTPLHRIGYFAFTKKAAGEAKGRMLDKHPELEEKDLPYFQTLHSFAFNLLGMKKVMLCKTKTMLLLVEKLVSKYLYFKR